MTKPRVIIESPPRPGRQYPRCPSCGGETHRYGRYLDKTRFACKDHGCRRTFLDESYVGLCSCGRPDNHRGVCSERATVKLREAARQRAYLARRQRTEGETMRSTTRRPKGYGAKPQLQQINGNSAAETCASSQTPKEPFCPRGCRRLEGGLIACQPDCETHARLGLGVAVEGKGRKVDPGFEGRERI